MPLASKSLATNLVSGVVMPPFRNVVSPRYNSMDGGVLSPPGFNSLFPTTKFKSAPPASMNRFLSYA